MKNYNYFRTPEEAFQYFRLPFVGKGIFCKTQNQEPYLQEIPIQIKLYLPKNKNESESLSLSEGNSENGEFQLNLQGILTTTSKKFSSFKKQVLHKETISLPSFKLRFQEDILSYSDSVHSITIQALNHVQLYLFWEKSEERKKILYNGKLIQKQKFWSRNHSNFIK